MPIQAPIKQANGATATYHVLDGLPNQFNPVSTQAQAQISSYLDQPSYAAGCTPLGTATYDVTGMLKDIASVPATGATVQQAIVGMTEQYLLGLAAFSGGAQVA